MLNDNLYNTVFYRVNVFTTMFCYADDYIRIVYKYYILRIKCQT